MTRPRPRPPTPPIACALALMTLLGPLACGEPEQAEEQTLPEGALLDSGPPDSGLPSALAEPEPEMELPAVPTVEDDEAPCQPGATRCLDEAVAQVCLRDGTWGDDPCVRGEACVAGADRCLPVVCEPGKSRCDGRWAQQTCGEDGRAWSFPSGCAADEQCLGGDCRACQPNSSECTSDVGRRTCANDGTHWLPSRVCETGLCFLGDCLVCVPGEGQCVADRTLRHCRPDGMGLEPDAVDCGDDARCRSGRCRPVCDTRILVVVDDSAPMAPYLDVVQRILDEMLARETYDLAFMSAKASRGCGNGVEPPAVPFGSSTAEGRGWLAELSADGTSQITDLMTWLAQNRERVWPGDAQQHVLILTAGGDACGPQGDRSRVDWNRSTYERLGGRLRGMALSLDIIDVGGDMDPQLNQLRICNGRGPALTRLETGAFEAELRASVDTFLNEADLCAR